MSQRAGGKTVEFFVDGQAGLAGGNLNPNSSSAVAIAAGFERVLALGTGFRSAVVEGGRASSGAILAGV